MTSLENFLPPSPPRFVAKLAAGGRDFFIEQVDSLFLWVRSALWFGLRWLETNYNIFPKWILNSGWNGDESDGRKYKKHLKQTKDQQILYDDISATSCITGLGNLVDLEAL